MDTRSVSASSFLSPSTRALSNWRSVCWLLSRGKLDWFIGGLKSTEGFKGEDALTDGSHSTNGPSQSEGAFRFAVIPGSRFVSETWEAWLYDCESGSSIIDERHRLAEESKRIKPERVPSRAGQRGWSRDDKRWIRFLWVSRFDEDHGWGSRPSFHTYEPFWNKFIPAYLASTEIIIFETSTSVRVATTSTMFN